MAHDRSDNPADTNQDVSQRKRLLREHGMRATASRVAVLGLLDAATAPISHADAVDALGPFGWDKATVYRNLLDLVRVGLATRTHLGDRLWRFERARHPGSGRCEHPHFICTGCGDVSCVPGVAVALRQRKGIPSSVREREVEVQIRGLCDKCREA